MRRGVLPRRDGTGRISAQGQRELNDEKRLLEQAKVVAEDVDPFETGPTGHWSAVGAAGVGLVFVDVFLLMTN